MKSQEIPVGIVGLGLMGCSIATCMLIAGHPVIAVAPISQDLLHARKRIIDHLQRSVAHGMLEKSPEDFLDRLTITEDYADLWPCRIVIECTLENKAIKE